MKLVLIHTGGTIGAEKTGSGLAVRENGTDRFRRLLKKELVRADLSLPTMAEAIGKLSENMIPEDWSLLARRIHQEIRQGADGIVVSHGTDTLIYSACALHWMLRGVPVPVVLTGSRLPLGVPKSDAGANVRHSLRVAASARPGIWISFSGRARTESLILDPLNARKEANREDAFQPVWDTAAGNVAPAGRLSWNQPRSEVAPYAPTFKIHREIALFTMHPGFKPDTISAAIAQGARGIVLAGYGSGTACASGSCDLGKALREAVRKRVKIWMVSQHGGWVEPIYGSAVALKKNGLRFKPGWTPEAAVTALTCRLDADALAGYRRRD